MTMVKLKDNTYALLKLVEKFYRERHPEFDNIPLSKDKLVFETIIFYLTDTKYEKEMKQLLRGEN